MEKLFQKWKRQKLIEQALLSLGIGFPLCSVLLLFWNTPKALFLPIALLCSLLVCILVLWRSGFFSLDLPDMAHFLNQKYPELEQSCDLLLQKEQALGGMALLQKEKTEQQLRQLQVQLPNHWSRALLVLLFGGVLSWGIQAVPPFDKTKKAAGFQSSQTTGVLATDSSGSILPPRLLEAKIQIRPPVYTRLPAQSQQDLNIEAPFWSTITWNLTFNQPMAEVGILLGQGQELPLRQAKTRKYLRDLRIEQSTFYQIKYRTEQSNWQLSDYYQINVIEDQPPEILVDGLPSYAEYVFNPDKTITFKVGLKDDYGIAGAWMVATVSKGEGESVKFRDDTLHFDQSFSEVKKRYQLQKTLRLGNLEMEAGDELYLHFEAKDQRAPVPQISKTYKYILTFEDPDRMEVDMAGGLAVNRMPEYFRSQRQIIIDTEKLIAERSNLKPVSFNEKSNNIAIDQKLLRLRYGRFLGEEFETVIGTGTAVAEEGHDHDHHHHDEEGAHHDHDHDHHDHDHEDGHHHEEQEGASQQSEDQYLAGDHDHEHEENRGGPSEDEEIKELEPYIHAHDIAEEVTYFDETTSAKLRAALAEMWDAELHLRMGSPEKALPYEYKALKLIKEIQQASRIYVERIGFDPPVIKVAEKRLTGDLDDIRNTKVNRRAEEAVDYPAIRAAIPILEKLKRPDSAVSAKRATILEDAGDELAGLALEQPGVFLMALQKLRAILEDEVEGKTRISYLESVQKVCWDVLSELEQPAKDSNPITNLQELFLQELLEDE